MTVIDSALLDILACPEDKGALLLVGADTLYNPRLRRAYRIEEGIPVLLVDEARQVGDEEHTEILRSTGTAE